MISFFLFQNLNYLNLILKFFLDLIDNIGFIYSHVEKFYSLVNHNFADIGF